MEAFLATFKHNAPSTTFNHVSAELFYCVSNPVILFLVREEAENIVTGWSKACNFEYVLRMVCKIYSEGMPPPKCPRVQIMKKSNFDCQNKTRLKFKKSHSFSICSMKV